MPGKTFRQVITASKAEFLAYLDKLEAEHRETAREQPTARGRVQDGGIADGIAIARRAVSAWRLTPDLNQLAALLEGINGSREHDEEQLANIARLLREADGTAKGEDHAEEARP